MCACGWRLATRTCARALMVWRCWYRRRCSAIRTAAPVRVPGPARRADPGTVARRPGHVPVREAAGARALHLAIFREWSGDDHAGAAWLFARELVRTSISPGAWKR